MAGPTRLELATSGVTGRRSNRLNYDPTRGCHYKLSPSPFQLFFASMFSIKVIIKVTLIITLIHHMFSRAEMRSSIGGCVENILLVLPLRSLRGLTM